MFEAKVIECNIYNILTQKNHNKHYLNRYYKFILSCKRKNSDNIDIIKRKIKTNKHHICPKAKDLFPEYRDFKQYHWNCVTLTLRQHFIAHWMLSKSYPCKSQFYAFNQMLNLSGKTNSKIFEKFKIIFSNILSQDLKNRENMGVKGLKCIYNSITGERKRILSTDTLPEGWIFGVPKNKIKRASYIKTFHDPATQKEYAIDIRYKIPDGFVEGRSYKFKNKIRETSKGNKGNLGRNIYHDPKTQKIYTLFSNDNLILELNLVKGRSEKNKKSISKKSIENGSNKGSKNGSYGKPSVNRKNVKVITPDNNVILFESIELFCNWYRSVNLNFHRKFWNSGKITSINKTYSKILDYEIIVGNNL